MLDFIGTIATATLMVLIVNAVIVFMAIPRGAKVTLAGILGVWIGLAAAAGAAGWIAIARPFPIIGIFVAFPLAAAALAASFPAARAAMLSVPMPLMIWLNIGRILAVLFFLLENEGRLGGPFPFFAGWGDIITGVAGILVARLALAGEAKHVTAIAAWNLFGTADLVNAIVLGVTSAPGSPLQILDAGAGSEAMQQLPWSFIPTALVPFYLIMHGIIWAQLWQHAKRGQPVKAAA